MVSQNHQRESSSGSKAAAHAAYDAPYGLMAGVEPAEELVYAVDEVGRQPPVFDEREADDGVRV